MSFVWGAVAIGGAALLNYAGSQNAASAQTNAANQANATQQQNLAQQQQNQQPWLNTGGAALGQLGYNLGLNGYQNGDPNNPGVNSSTGSYGSLMTPFSQSQFQTDPGYQFRLAQGQQALDRTAAAKGGLLSGAQLKATDQYNQNFASNEYSNAYNRYNNDQTNMYNRLAGTAGVGQQSANMLGQLGSNTANQISNTQSNLGNALGANYLTQGNALTGSINQGLNMWNSQNNWNQLMGNGGSYGNQGYTSGLGGSMGAGNYWSNPGNTYTGYNGMPVDVG